MPSYVKRLSTTGLLCLLLHDANGMAEDFGARVKHAELSRSDSGWQINANIDYHLSPVAKEALHKGIPLTWKVYIEIRRPGLLWDSRLYQQKLRYTLQFHALLNQYALETPDAHTEMFLSLNAALNDMARLHQTLDIEDNMLDGTPQLAVKSQFHRESLPVPLRPFSYLDQGWFLSSAWWLCPIQK